MSRSTHVISPLLGLLALSSGAFASDLTIKSRLSETFEFNDNNGQGTVPSSGTIGSFSTISSSLLYRTPRSSFTTDGSFSYRKTFNLDDEPDAEGTKNHSVGMSYNTFFKSGDRFFVSGSYRSADAASVQRDVLGFSTVGGNQITYNVSGGYTHILSPTDTLTLIGSHVISTYTGSDATPTTSTSGSAIWNRQVNRRFNLNATSSASFTEYDNVSETKTLSWRNTVGLTALLTGDLTFSVNAGAVMFDTRANSVSTTTLIPALIPNPDGTFSQDLIPFAFDAPAQTGTSVGPIVDAVLSYRLNQKTDMSVSVSYGSGRGALSDLSTATSVSGRLSHRINHYSSLSFALALSRQEAEGFSSDSLSASAAYSYLLTRDMQAQLSYSYRLRHSEFGETVNNTVVLAITQDITLKP